MVYQDDALLQLQQIEILLRQEHAGLLHMYKHFSLRLPEIQSLDRKLHDPLPDWPCDIWLQDGPYVLARILIRLLQRGHQVVQVARERLQQGFHEHEFHHHILVPDTGHESTNKGVQRVEGGPLVLLLQILDVYHPQVLPEHLFDMP